MIVYRITSRKHADKLDGKGAARSNSNRWNSRGTEIIYTAESEALARAELAGHINLSLLPDPVLIKIQVPEKDIAKLRNLPDGWNEVPPANASKKVGDEMVQNGLLLGIAVPSRYDRKAYNYLLNPNFIGFGDKVLVIEIKDLK